MIWFSVEFRCGNIPVLYCTQFDSTVSFVLSRASIFYTVI